MSLHEEEENDEELLAQDALATLGIMKLYEAARPRTPERMVTLILGFARVRTRVTVTGYSKPQGWFEASQSLRLSTPEPEQGGREPQTSNQYVAESSVTLIANM